MLISPVEVLFVELVALEAVFSLVSDIISFQLPFVIHDIGMLAPLISLSSVRKLRVTIQRGNDLCLETAKHPEFCIWRRWPLPSLKIIGG